MHSFTFSNFLISYCLPLSFIILLFGSPTFGLEQIDGFRDLKFSLTPPKVKALTNCTNSHECIYQLSDKNRYLNLTYDSDHTTQEAESTENLRLAKITIDMGQYTEDGYNQLQMILGKSYRLTHDFTDDTLKAFLSKEVEELQTGYEDGQVVLKVRRRQFGNMILKIIYQNSSLAGEFRRQSATPPSPTP